MTAHQAVIPACFAAAVVQEAAVYDADGHMVKLCEVSTGTITKTTTDCTTSGTGATTLALAWNALEHLQTATRTGVGAVTESYAYDDSGRRIAKISAGIIAAMIFMRSGTAGGCPRPIRKASSPPAPTMVWATPAT